MPREDRYLLRMMRFNRFLSSPRLRAELIRRTGRRMSVRTITRRLLEAGYHSRRPTRSPRLTIDHRRRRRQWARRHRERDLRHWRHGVFTDESRFKLHCTEGWIRVRRREGERHIDVCVQHTDGNVGPSIMVWGGFHFGGKSELIIVDGNMNQQVYRRVLQQNLLPWARGTFQNNFVLVQDNAPPHKARATMTFLENQDVEVMDWLAKSPDMNPIEHLWDQMAVYIRDMDNPPTTLHQLLDALLAAWDALRPERLRSLVRSMLRRARALLAAHGGHTRY